MRTDDSLDILTAYAPTTTPLEQKRLSLARASTERKIAALAETSSGRGLRLGHRPSRAGRRARWLVPSAAGALALGIGTAWLVQPAPAQAYEGWTAIPAVTSAPEAAAEAGACRAAYAEAWKGHEPPLSGATVAAMAPVIAESRGPWRLVLLGNPQGNLISCLNDKVVVEDSIPGVTGVELAEKSSTHAILAFGMAAPDGPDGPVTYYQGNVTGDVSAIRFAFADGRTVDASIGGGAFVAWWPGADTSSGSTQEKAPVSATLTYTDGTSKTVSFPAPGDSDTPLEFNGGVSN